MTPTWERTAGFAPIDRAALLMDAVLRPHRSLSAAAFRMMLIGVIAVNAILSLVFIAQGAFPVAGFLGLDVLALWLAFRWNYRSGKVEERVRVARGRVEVTAIDPDGAETYWTLNPVWARVARDGKGVLIRSGARQMRLGVFLSPRECDEFAQALSGALYRAKN